MRSYDQIKKTLDEHGQCDGCSYMDSVMTKFCGGVYVVRKRIDVFFDERSQRMLKPRNVVILDGVCCEPARAADEAWAGCDRTCYLFWKEAWLERVSECSSDKRSATLATGAASSANGQDEGALRRGEERVVRPSF